MFDLVGNPEVLTRVFSRRGSFQTLKKKFYSGEKVTYLRKVYTKQRKKMTISEKNYTLLLQINL